jgi:hypothetical protein
MPGVWSKHEHSFGIFVQSVKPLGAGSCMRIQP